MRNTNNWILDNIALVILLNVVLGGLFAFVVVRHAYKILKKQQISPLDWAIFIGTIAIGIIMYILTGTNDSSISL